MGEHVQLIVNRALLMSRTGTPGPVYLTATREVLAAESKLPKPVKVPSCIVGGLPPDAVDLIANALVNAERPLVVTGYLGRSNAAVKELIRLADAVGHLLVFDFEYREMSFPANHPAWRARATGAGPAIRTSDVILVLDADVPWIPVKIRPKEDAKIFHIDLDPRKEKMNLFDIHTEATYHADTAIALGQLCTKIEEVSPELSKKEVESRKQAYDAAQEQLLQRANPSEDGLLTKEFLFQSLRELLPEDSILVHDAVTNQITLTEQVQLSRPGSNFSKGGSGLGWACGAAIGITLASRKYDLSNRPDVKANESSGKFVCMVTGDGCFMFSTPSAIYWAAYRHNTPFLSIVINNGGWKATRACVNDVHPEGLAAKISDKDLGIDLRVEGPDYGSIAKAATGGKLWTEKVSGCGDLEKVLKAAIEEVKQGRSALVDAVIKN